MGANTIWRGKMVGKINRLNLTNPLPGHIQKKEGVILQLG